MESAYLYSSAEQSEFINSCLERLKPKGRQKKNKNKMQHERTHSLPPPMTRKAMSDPVLTTRYGTPSPRDKVEKRNLTNKRTLQQPLPSPLSVRGPPKPESKALKVLGIEPSAVSSQKRCADPEPKAEAARVLRYHVNGMTITVEKDAPSDHVPERAQERSARRSSELHDSEHYSMTSTEAREILESVGWRMEGKEKVMQNWTDWVDTLMQGNEMPKGGDNDWRESWEDEDDLDVGDLRQWLESYGCKMTPVLGTEEVGDDDEMEDIPIALG